MSDVEPGEPGLVVEGVEFSYRDAEPVLDGVSLEVPRGTVHAILGPSGCGKTTLLRVVAGLEHPSAGSVTSVGGRVLTDVSAGTSVDLADRGVAMVFQNWALFPHMTVEGNVSFAMPREVRKDGSLLAETLAMVGLEGLAERMPAELSGGQQQRVALGRALAQRPEVLLLDEPFSNLDHRLRARVRTEVRDLLEELEVTTVLVTHDRDEAFILGDAVTVMRDGRVVAQGDPAALYHRPPDPWSATFLGEATLLTGTIDAEHRVHTEIAAMAVIDPERFEPGQEVEVMVRPENLGLQRLSDLGEDLGDATSVVVSEVRYNGPSTTYDVSVGAKVLSVWRPGVPEFERGERAALIPPEQPVMAWERRSNV